MTFAALEPVIEAAWEARDGISLTTRGEVRDAVEATLEALDRGILRVAEKNGNDWQVNQWAKKAVLLSFRLNDMPSSRVAMAGRRGGTRCRPSSKVGARTSGAPPVSAPCRGPSSAGRPLSGGMWC